MSAKAGLRLVSRTSSRQDADAPKISTLRRPYGAKTAHHYGSIRTAPEKLGQPIGVHDLHIAAHACRRGHSALYQRLPRLGEELRIRHANGTFTRWLDTLKNTDVLLLDDWGMTAMDSQTRADLLEIIDDRASQRATIITSQLSIGTSG